MTLRVMVHFVSCDKDVWFLLWTWFCFCVKGESLLATDTKWKLMSDICLKITQVEEGRG